MILNLNLDLEVNLNLEVSLNLDLEVILVPLTQLLGGGQIRPSSKRLSADS